MPSPAIPKAHINKVEMETVAVAKAIPSPAVSAAAATVLIQQQPVLSETQQWMQEAGIAQTDWPAVDYIVSHESGWCPTKWEGEYGICPAYHRVSDYDGYGLCQSTPPQKMAAAGDDWRTNPVTQLKWCTTHADDEYGGWWNAYNHWTVHHNW